MDIDRADEFFGTLRDLGKLYANAKDEFEVSEKATADFHRGVQMAAADFGVDARVLVHMAGAMAGDEPPDIDELSG